MKIAVTVVLYNPSNKEVENLKTYCRLFDRVYALDNSDTGFIMPKELLADVKMSYKRFGENLGIAYGLKTACEMANSDGFDLLLTMDQDSKYPVADHDNILREIESLDLTDIGIVCLNTEGYKEKYKDDTGKMFVDMFITSGNFIVLKNYFKTEGFDEKLFIDLVDFDICYKFKNSRFKIILLTKYYLIHSVGNYSKKNIVFKSVTFSDHSAIRYYYRFRNDYYLYHKDKNFFKIVHKGAKKDKIKLFMFGVDKKKKFKMIRRGIKDAKKGILGKYKD